MQRYPDRDDRGSITVFFVVIAFGLLVVVGLVVDGGGQIRAWQRADSVAADAARAGGQAIVAGRAIRGQSVQVQLGQARAAAQSYLAAAGVHGTATVTGGTELQVDTTSTYEPVFLNIVGVGTLRGTGHAQVQLVRGLKDAQ